MCDVALACALALSLPHSTAASPPRIARHRIEGLPLGARGIVSAVLGREFVQQGELSDKQGGSGEEFGEALAVSGRTLVVGTINHIVASTGVEQGAAYVFTEPASGWAHAQEVAMLKAPRGQSEEEFGLSVVLSGDTILLGAPDRAVNGDLGQGVVYTFRVGS